MKVELKCSKMLCEDGQQWYTCSVRQQVVPDVGAGDWKGPFADCSKMERWYCQTGGSNTVQGQKIHSLTF